MTTWDNYKNFAYGIIAVAPFPATSGGTFQLVGGQGALFASGSFPIVLCPPGVEPTLANAEIAYCSARSLDAFTITRAQEGTTAKAVDAGWQVIAGPTVKTLTDIQGAVTALETAVAALQGNTTPTITSFVNAVHSHSNNAGGGLLGASALSAHAITNVLLNVQETTDLHNGTVVPATTWTDFLGNKNFTVSDANSIIQVNIRARAHLGSTSAATDTTSRAIIDSAGTPITRYLGGMNSSQASHYANPFAGSCTFFLTGLAAGVHTIKTQVYGTAANQAMYCRIVAVPSEEFYATEIIEHIR